MLQRAVALRPSFETALIHLVTALDANGQPEEAAAACSKLARVAETAHPPALPRRGADF